MSALARDDPPHVSAAVADLESAGRRPRRRRHRPASLRPGGIHPAGVDVYSTRRPQILPRDDRPPDASEAIWGFS
jgi:hypothetical protein